MRSWAFVDRSLTSALVLLLSALFLFACARSTDPSIDRDWRVENRLFPWPPPQASATEVIPRTLLEPKLGPTRLRNADQRITEALEQNGYYERRYYAVPEGFALVTRMEQIESDGTSKQGPQRWTLQPPLYAEFSITAYFAALLRGMPGYYRVIVFVVTPFPFEQSTAKVTPNEIEEWYSGGLNRLPPSIGNLEFSHEGYACTALIYEFERPPEVDEPRIRLPGRIPGRIHLVKAGIWEKLQE